ncbi:FMN-binding protein [Cellulomonas sp. P5_C6]
MTIVGSTVQTRYGPVQVSVTFASGQITDVQALQTPGGHGESIMINQRATPILAQEVVSAQSAHIDTVSGATYTSEAYAESVQSAIDQKG